MSVSALAQPKWDLAYLFAAHFADGSEILQTPTDISSMELGRSAFTDVERRIEGGVNCDSFAIYNSDHVYAVDLRDGHFEFKLSLPAGGIVTTAFHAFPVAAPSLPPGGIFRLIYFRDHQQDIIAMAGKPDRLGEHRVFYRLGWNYDVMERGELKTYSQTIVVT